MKFLLRHTFASSLVLAGFLLPGAWAFAIQAGVRKVTGLQVHGAVRSDVQWLQDYIGIDFPADLSDLDVQRIRQKLMTADVFIDVQVRVEYAYVYAHYVDCG